MQEKLGFHNVSRKFYPLGGLLKCSYAPGGGKSNIICQGEAIANKERFLLSFGVEDNTIVAIVRSRIGPAHNI
ncbi:hypothetical protein C5167_031877 [Papaver somniferum]|uniref:Uncharacterized protein n=1 Tax=Papaver somniferum TaxID=3469 RepID=A0A4Y7K6W8_PAPSO|nr:hypothetical protein C5167_031877 [Papaver somniferum]